MSTATLTLKAPIAPIAGAVASKGKSQRTWLQRFYDAMIEARMRQARRELGRYLATVPQDEVKEAGLRVGLTDDAALPFTR